MKLFVWRSDAIEIDLYIIIVEIYLLLVSKTLSEAVNSYTYIYIYILQLVTQL